MCDPIRGSPIVLIDTVTQIGTFPFAAHPTGELAGNLNAKLRRCPAKPLAVRGLAL